MNCPVGRKVLGCDMWQPIETAPKDQPILLLSEGGDLAFAHWKKGELVWLVDVTKARSSKLIHWMPLPEPPKKAFELDNQLAVADC